MFFLCKADVIENESEVHIDDRGDSILKEEFKNALRGLKANKAQGVDLISVELLQNLGQVEKNTLFNVVYNMYEAGEIPTDLNPNKTVTVPIKVGEEKCKN